MFQYFGTAELIHYFCFIISHKQSIFLKDQHSECIQTNFFLIKQRLNKVLVRTQLCLSMYCTFKKWSSLEQTDVCIIMHYWFVVRIVVFFVFFFFFFFFFVSSSHEWKKKKKKQELCMMRVAHLCTLAAFVPRHMKWNILKSILKINFVWHFRRMCIRKW